MNYIVFDLEFNQDIDSIQISLTPNLKPPFEIIQIGAVKLDSSFNLLEKFNCYIKPIIYSNINTYVSNLTGITNEDLSLEKNFPSVYESFIKFIGNDEFTFCTWGSSDIKELYNNIYFHKLNSENLSKKFINIQPYASKALGLKSKNLSSLEFAVEKLNIEVLYDFHNALNDAYYTAEVFKKIYNPSIKPSTYDPLNLRDKPKKKNIKVDYDALIKQFSKIYNRSMTNEEEEIIKLAYKMGKTHQFLKSIDIDSNN